MNFLKTLYSLSMTVAMAVAMSGCEYFRADGSLVVKDQLQAVVKIGVFGNPELRVIPVGQFQAHFSMSSENRAELTFVQEGKKIRIPMTINAEKIPSQGDFVLTSQDLKQPFSIRGNLNTKQNRGPEISETESCQTRGEVYDCWRDRHNHRQCGYVDRLVPGRRYVRYYELETSRVLKANILGVKNARALFSGVDREVSKVYQFQGTCIAHGD